MFIILIVAKTFYKMRKTSLEEARYARNAESRVRDAALAEIDSNIAHDAERVARKAERKEREEACEEPEAARNAAEYVEDLRTAVEYEAEIAALSSNIAALSSKITAVAYEAEIAARSSNIACIAVCSAREEERSLRCVRRSRNAAEYIADLRTAVEYEAEIAALSSNITAVAYEAEIAARSFNIACIAVCSAREEERSLRCVRRLISAKLNIIKNFNKYKLVNRIDIAATEYIKENPLQDNIQLTGTTFNNCIKSANHYDIKVAKKLSNLFLEAGVSQSNVIKAIHIMNKHFFKDTTKTIQYLRNLFLLGGMEQSNFITESEIMYYKADERTIQYFFPGILRKLNNWDSWDFELNCALDCTTYPNKKFLEIDTYFKRKCSKFVTKEDIKEFKEFEDNKLMATFLLVNQRLASTGKYVSISILDMLYLLKRYDNKLR